MIVGVDFGHTLSGANYGAVGILKESEETRSIGKLVIAGLQKRNHKTVNCTVDYASNNRDSLNKRIANANRQRLDLFVSIHLNASKNQTGHGVEIFTYNGKQLSESKRVIQNISNLGYRNRGVKKGNHLSLVRRTNSPAMLIECFFLDNAGDVARYNKQDIANAIVSGICDTKIDIQKPLDPIRNTKDMMFPIPERSMRLAKYTSEYGNRWRRLHRGIDIALPEGSPLVAMDDGKVVYSKVNGGGVNTGYGYYLVLKYDNGLYSLYGHLKRLPDVKSGQRVNKGQVVAYSGNTGASTGSHLHLEIHEGQFLFRSQVKGKDSAVDPLKYLSTLKGKINQYLSIINNSIKGDDIVEFEHKWQEDLLIKTLKNLEKKGALNNSKDWIKKFKDKKMTNSELGLVALVSADRD